MASFAASSANTEIPKLKQKSSNIGWDYSDLINPNDGPSKMQLMWS